MTAEYCFQGLENRQWDYCCHILICMVRTMVRSLRFTLPDFKSANVICPEVKNYLHYSATLSLLNSMHKQSNSKEIECSALVCFNVCIIQSEDHYSFFSYALIFFSKVSIILRFFSQHSRTPFIFLSKHSSLDSTSASLDFISWPNLASISSSLDFIS